MSDTSQGSTSSQLPLGVGAPQGSPGGLSVSPGQSSAGSNLLGGTAKKSEPPQPDKGRWASWALIGLSIAGAITVTTTAISGVFTQEDSGQEVVAGPQTIEAIAINGMAFTPNTVTVPRGNDLVLEITNNDEVSHDLLMGDKESATVTPGNTITFDVGVIEENLSGWCDKAGHKASGMVFDVIVAE